MIFTVITIIFVGSNPQAMEGPQMTYIRLITSATASIGVHGEHLRDEQSCNIRWRSHGPR